MGTDPVAYEVLSNQLQKSGLEKMLSFKKDRAQGMVNGSNGGWQAWLG